MDFTRICRICLKSTNKQTFDIYTSLYIKRNTLYSEMLSYCTKLKLYQGDGLPRLICKECCRQLKRTYSFNLQCQESDKKLRQYLERNGEIKVTHCNNSVINYNNVELKNEDINGMKSENIQISAVGDDKGHQNILIGMLEDDRKNKYENIKIEPHDDEAVDSCWDADDDDLLTVLKNKKSLIDSNDNEAIENGWDVANDDIFDVLKDKKDFNDLEIEEHKPKKKRGRKRKAHLDGHLPTIPESKLPHQCDICGKFLSTMSNLKAHKICHTDERPYKCTDCTAEFRGYSALFQHKKIHTGETPYHCEYCPKQFRRRTGLVNHLRMHTGDKHFICNVCHKKFVQSSQLCTHMRRHQGDKPWLCHDCGKGFTIKADLRVHQRVHSGEKPYSCHLCPKTFATSGNLSIHVRIHNKEVRYKCKECHRGFVTCTSYNVHMKRHKGQKDYHCECGKTFYTSSSLNQHKVVHTGERKYQCKICDRKFSQPSHLTRHFKKDHAKPNEPLPSSDHYKLIVTSEKNKNVFDTFEIQKVPDVNSGVKCEES